MKKGKCFLMLITACFLPLLACSAKVGKNETQLDKIAKQICPEPRPEICTQQYDPVCGHLKEGGSKTYSNWCTACSDISVEIYSSGECP